MFYYPYHFGGMHLICWIIWIGFICWIFATPWNIPGKMKKKNSPLYILQGCFALAQIDKDEYREQKEILANGLTKL